MIDGMFQAGTDQALDDQVARPKPFKPEEPGFSLGQLAKAPFQGVSSGTTKMAAFSAEVLGAFGETTAATGIATERGMFSTPTPEERKQSEESRRKVLENDNLFSNEAGDLLRARAKEVMPDPTSTHASAQLVAGVAEFATQAVTYAAVTGPLAPALLGADVGLAEADKLKQQGVDLPTRAKAGAVAGAVAGASIALPVAVPGSVAKTAAAVVAGGPGGFIAQNAAERAILDNAGYKEIANTYDPLDPVGLALSTIVPAGFGAVALRGARTAPKPAPTLHEVVLGIESGGNRYGKDGKVLTSPKGAKGEMQVMDDTNLDPGFGVRPAKDASLEERARVGRDYLDAMLKRYGSEDKAMAAYNAGPGALDIALARAKKDGGDWLSYLPEETRGYVSKGMKKLGTERTAAGARAVIAAEPEAVAAARVQQTAQTVETYRLSPSDDLAGRTAHQDAIESAHALIARGEPVQVTDLLRIGEPANDHPFIPWSQQINGAIEEMRAARGVEPAPAVEKVARQPDGIAPAERADGTLNAKSTGKDVTSPFQSLIDELAPQLTGKQPGQLVNELKTGGKLSPLANNAIVGLAETGGDPKRIAQLVSHAESLARETPGRPVADIMADAVEMMRAGEAQPQPKLASPTTQAAARIEQANPDMPVRVSEDGQRVSALEELEAIRKEAAEGTDTTLGANDSPLLQVAAECFLSTGGI